MPAQNPYSFMTAMAGETSPEFQDQLQKMMFARMLMGGGAAMASAASRPGATYGQSLASGLMGGVKSMDDFFGQALRMQMYANQRNQQNIENKRADERLKLAKTEAKANADYRAQTTAATAEYRKSQEARMRAANAEDVRWHDIMAGIYKNRYPNIADLMSGGPTGGNNPMEPSTPQTPEDFLKLEKTKTFNQKLKQKFVPEGYANVEQWWGQNQLKYLDPNTIKSLSAEDLQQAMGYLSRAYDAYQGNKDQMYRIAHAYQAVRDRLTNTDWGAMSGTIQR